MYEMLGFIAEMIMEKTENQTPVMPRCAVLDRNAAGVNYKDARWMHKMLKDPATALRLVDGKFFFNDKDISMEVEWMKAVYMKHDFKKLGFLLGDTLDKALKDKERPTDPKLFLY